MHPVKSASYQARHQRSWVRCVARCLLMVSLWQNLLLGLPAQAQTPPLPLTAHPQAPSGQRPLIDAARNGVPIVMIAPPSAAGVSLNGFSQFNVNENGLILGNNPTLVQTQLGGWIAPNLQLGATPARIILNEVLSSDPSRLKGAIEVAGQRADIVIANPNGIHCDGCGFLNSAGRATLTTGRPQFSSGGSLQGFDVQRGQLSIGAAGLSASNIEQLDLLARGLVIEGEIWARNLQILAGVNQVLYANLQTLPSTADAAGGAPRFAIDIKDLGGMVADRIRLIATEQGLGVNSTGRITALQGNLQLSANGDLTLKDSFAQGSLAIRSSGDVTLSGQTQSQGAMRIDSGARLRQAGELAAGGQLSLNAASFDNSNAIIARSSDALAIQVDGAALNSGVIFSGGNLQLGAQRFSSRGGSLVATGELVLDAQSADLADSSIQAGGNVTLHATRGGFDSRHTRIGAAGNLGVDAVDALTKTGGTWVAGGVVNLQGASINNLAGDIQAGGALNLNTPGVIDNTGGKLLGSVLALSGAGLINERGVVGSDHAMQIASTGAINNRNGTVQALDALVIRAQGEVNNAAGALWAGKALSLNAGDLNNDAGKIVAHDRVTIDSARTSSIGGLMSAGGALGLHSASFDNSRGEIAAGSALAIDTGARAFVNTGGRLLASGDIDLLAGAVTSNNGAVIASAKNIHVQAGSLNNSGARISADASKGVVRISLGDGDFSNNGGGISAAALVEVNAGRLSNQRGQINADNALKVSAALVDNSGGTISALQSLNIASQASIKNAAGRLLGDGDVTVNGSALDNTDGIVSAGRSAKVALGSGSLANTGGRLIGVQTLTLETGAIVNSGGRILTDGALSLNTRGLELDNAGGVIHASGALNLDSAVLNNAGGLLSSGTAINISSAALDNAGGAVQAGKDLQIVTSAAVNNPDGDIRAAGNAVLTSAGLDNSGGRIAAGGVSISTDRLRNDAGASIIALGALHINASASSNQGGLLSANSGVTLHSATLDNRGGEVSSGGQLAIDTHGLALDNAGGLLLAVDAMALRSGALTNDAGRIVSGATLAIDSDRIANRSAFIGASGDVRINSAAQLDNSRGTIDSGRRLALNAGELNNAAGRISATGAAAIDVGSGAMLDNRAGSIVAAGLALTSGAVSNNTGGLIGASGDLSITTRGQALDNDHGRLQGDASLRLQAGATSNIGGRMLAGQQLSLNSSALDNTSGDIVAAGTLGVNAATGNLLNTDGRIVGGSGLQLTAGALRNDAGGVLGSHQDVTLALASLNNGGGAIQAERDLRLNVSGGASNLGGSMVAKRDLFANLTGELRNGGVIHASGDALLHLGDLNNDGGQLLTGGSLALQAGRVTNRVAGAVVGQIVGGGNVTITTPTLDNGGGIVQAFDTLKLDSGKLDNSEGLLRAAQAHISSQALDNTRGEISTVVSSTVASGALDIDTHGQELRNVDGRIFAAHDLHIGSGAILNRAERTAAQIGAGNDIRIEAASLDNAGSLLRAAGALQINASGALTNDAQGLIGATRSVSIVSGVTSNRSGVITSGSGTTLNTAALDNHGGEISSAGNQTINSNGQPFDNTGGRVVAQAALAIHAADLINTDGRIISRASLDIAAASIANGAAVIGSVGDVTLTTSGTLDNASGEIIGNTLRLKNGALINGLGGTISSADQLLAAVGTFENAGRVTASGGMGITVAGAARNSGGEILSTGDLALGAASIDNSHATIGAGQALRLASGGVLRNSQGQIQGGQVNINAGAVSNDRGGVISSNSSLGLDTAGQTFDNTDGLVQTVGALKLQAGATANVRGRMLAGQELLVANSGGFDNTDGKLAAAASLGIELSGHDLSNKNGSILSAAGLNLQLGLLHNAGGVVGTNQNLTLRLAGVENGDGALQAGGDLAIASNGDVTNSGGQILAGRDATLSAASLSNAAQGLLSAVRDVQVTIAGEIRNSGTLQAGRDARLTAGALRNENGNLLSKGALQITTSGVVSNTNGAISAQGALGLNALSIDNTRGALFSGADITLALADGALLNDGGSIVSNAAISARAASLSNRQGRISAAEGLAISAGSGAIDNADGIIVGKLLSLDSGALDNTGGAIAAVQGSLSINTLGGKFTNDSGRIQSAQALTLRSGASSNRAGLISADDFNFTSDSFDNSAGKVVAVRNLSGNARAVNNNAGLFQAGVDLKLTTNGQLLSNADSGTGGGILSGGALDLAAGSIDNRNGVIGATGKSFITVSGAIDNSRAGLISSASDSSLTAASVNNANGRIEAGRALNINAVGTLDNRAGSLVAQGDVNLNAATLDNSAAGLIDGYNVNLTSVHFNNAGGTVRAANDASINAGEFDNTGGSLSAVGRAQVSAPSLKNAGGRLAAGKQLQVSTSSAAPGGEIASRQDLTLSFSGDYNNAGTLFAGENLSITAANIDNSGVLNAGATFSASTGNLLNSGAIAAGSNRIAATGAVTNTGLIDAIDNRIAAAALDNIGSGLIYGGGIDGSGQLQVSAGRIANDAGASIMSRSDLRLVGQALQNSAGSLIYSLGDIEIDAQQSLSNDGARIESSHNLTISSASILNRNAGLTTHEVTQAPVDKVLVQPVGMSKQYPLELCTGIGGGQDENTCIEHPDKFGQRSVLPTIHSGGEAVCGGGEDNSCSTTPVTTNYAWNAAEFTRFGIVPIASAAPAEPDGAGACSSTILTGGDNAIPLTVEVNSAPCNQWRANYANWSADFDVRLTALGGKIDAYNAEVNEDNRLVTFQDYTVFRVTGTSVRTEVLSSAPAQLFAGGDLNLIGSTVNLDSQIVAGGTARIIAGPPVLNLASQGVQRTEYHGTEQTSTVEACGRLGSDHCRESKSPVPYNPAPTIDPPFDLLEVRVISAENRSTNKTPPAGAGVNVAALSASGATVIGTAQGSVDTSLGSAIDAAYRASQDRLSGTMIGQPEAPKQVALSTPAAGTLVAGQGGSATAAINQIGQSSANPQLQPLSPGATAASGTNNAELVGSGLPIPAAIAPAAVQPPRFVAQAAPSTTTAASQTAVHAAKAPRAGRLPFTIQSVTAPGDILVRTAMTGLVAPTASVYRIHSEPGARYLVETDPRFTQFKAFIGSDYFLQQLQMDPERQLKRYADGFYEQQQVNDQILALTGRRYLTDYSSTETEYKALMDAGVAYAREYQLSPGVALSAGQMTRLTSDIVWLTAQTVTLADGRSEQVLVPQVYLRRARDGDLQQSGALIAGSDVFISSEQGIVNSGAIQAGRSTTLLAGQDLLNQGGRISGQDVLLRSNRDLLNLSGTIQGIGRDSIANLWAGRDLVLRTVVTDSSNTDGSSTRTNIGRIATVQGGAVLLTALRDLDVIGSTVTAASDLTAGAGRDLKVSAVEGRYQIAVHDTGGGTVAGRSGYISDSSVSNTVSVLSAGNDVSLGANNLLTLKGANLDAANDLLIQGGKVDIAALRDSVSTDIQTLGTKNYNRIARSEETLAGGNVTAGRNLTVDALGAGGLKGDIDVKGAYLSSKNGELSLSAQDTINIAAVTTAQSSISEQYSKSGNLVSTRTTTTAASSDIARVEGSVVSGKSVALRAGSSGDVRVIGSSVVGDDTVKIEAGNNVTITNAAQISHQQNSRDEQTSGLFSNGGASVTWGKREIAQQRSGETSEQIGSSVASLGGDVRMNAGEQYTQTASRVLAPRGSVDITGKFVDINSASHESSSAQQDRSKQSGLTLAASTPILSTLQSIEKTTSAASNTNDSRMLALAGATLAMRAKEAIDISQAGAQNQNLTLSLTVGGSRSESSQASSTSTVSGSTVAAGNDVSIKATGAGVDSHLTVSGSEIQAGNRANLSADGAINLLAAQNTAEQHSTSTSSSAGMGVAITYGPSGTAFGVTANASAAQGNADGRDVSWTNTRVTAGNIASTSSGTDTNLKGAVVSAQHVDTLAGTSGVGNLTIQSLQDTSNYRSRDQSIGGSVTIGAGVAGSASASRGKVDAEYASVGDQSGIKAGDGGFTVNVNGNTDLQGGVIGSSQAAVDHGKNSLTTASLTRSHLQNKDHVEASSVGVSLALSSQPKAQTRQPAADKATASDPGSAGFTSTPGASAGFGSASGTQTGTTVSGISGAAIRITNEAQQKALTGQDGAVTIASLAPGVTTASTNGALAKSWNGQQLKQEVDAQRDITQAFSQAAPKAVATYADSRLAEAAILRAKAGKESDPAKIAALTQEARELEVNWKEGGVSRIALHTAVGAMSGGVAGAAGAAVASSAATQLNDLQAGVQAALVRQGASDATATAIAQGFGAVTALAIGGAVGGVGGAAAGVTVDVNNRQLHPDETRWIKENSGRYAAKKGISQAEAEKVLGQQAYRQVQDGAVGIWDADANAFLKQAHGMLAVDLNCPSCGPGYMFQVTAAQKANADLYVSLLPQTADFYVKNGIQTPTPQQVAAGTQRGSNARDTATTRTLLAPAAAASAALAGLAPAVATWALANPVAATNAGVITADVAAQIASGAVNPGTVTESMAVRGGAAGASRAIPGNAGHFGANTVTPGGTGTALTGHGGRFLDSPSFVVPEGSAVTLPRPNISILDRTGQYIEKGDWEGLAALAKKDPRVARDVEGITTWLPGAKIPGYTLFPPDKGINLFSRSHSVYEPTPLRQILEPNLGCIQWAACTSFLPYTKP